MTHYLQTSSTLPSNWHQLFFLSSQSEFFIFCLWLLVMLPCLHFHIDRFYNLNYTCLPTAISTIMELSQLFIIEIYDSYKDLYVAVNTLASTEGYVVIIKCSKKIKEESCKKYRYNTIRMRGLRPKDLGYGILQQENMNVFLW